MCTALPLDEIYPALKFHNPTPYSLRDMHHTKFKFEKKKTRKGNNSNIKQARVAIYMHGTPP